MFKNETKNAMMAMAVVAMFMLSACAVMITDDSDAEDAYTNAAFKIIMHSDDTFSYTPTSNISGTTFKFEGKTSAALPEGLNATVTSSSAATTNTLTITNPAKGNYGGGTTSDYAIKVIATHAASGQTKYQYISFVVYDSMVINGGTNTDSKTILNTLGSDVTVGTYGITGGRGTNNNTPNVNDMTATIAVKSGSSAGAKNTDLAVEKTTSGYTIKTNKANLTAGDSYTVTLGAAYTIAAVSTGTTSNACSDTANNVVVTVTVSANDVAISPTTGVAYAGEASKDVAITSSSTAMGSNYTVSAYAISGNTYDSKTIATVAKNQSGNNAVLTINASQLTNTSGSLGTADHVEITMPITQTYTYAGQTYTKANDFVLTLYRALEFTTSPVLNGNPTSFSSSVNGLDVLMTSNIRGATKITYNWGDGTETINNYNNTTGDVFYTASHSYSQAGTYFITVTAANDFGETSYITSYSTGPVILMNADKTLKMTGIDAKEQDGKLILTAKTLVNDGNTPSYKWTYTSGDVKNQVITTEDKPAWVEEVSGKTLTLTKADIPDNTKFVCEASFTFEGDTEAKTTSASYVYNDTSFIGQNGWILWVLPIVAIALIVLMLFVTGPLPVMIYGTAGAVIAEILLLALRYFAII